jgi:hypothetical protein
VSELVDGAPHALRKDRPSAEAERAMERSRALEGRVELRGTGRLIAGTLVSRDPADLERLREGLSWQVRDLCWHPPGPFGDA